MENYKKITTLLAVIISMSLPLQSYALEVAYPWLGSKTLGESPSIIDFVVYYFNFALILGVLIAMVIIIFAAFEIVMAQGNSTKIMESRNRIMGAAVGLVVLFGSYVIIGVVNKDIFNITPIETHCQTGIQVISSNNTETCITSDQAAGLNLTGATINWKSTADTLPAVYIYTEENYMGTPDKVLNGGDIHTAKSIAFITGEPGVYLYDGTGYNPIERSNPFFITGGYASLDSVRDLTNNRNYNDIIKSIEIKNDSLNYGILAYTGLDKSGSCAYISQSTSNLNDRGSGINNNPPIGQNQISSVEVFKTYPNSINRGSVILYQGPKCTGTPCTTISVTGSGELSNTIVNQCGGDARIKSLRITGPVGVAIRSSANECRLWTYAEVKDKDQCGDIFGSLVFPSSFDPKYPVSFMIFPIDLY